MDEVEVDVPLEAIEGVELGTLADDLSWPRQTTPLMLSFHYRVPGSLRRSLWKMQRQADPVGVAEETIAVFRPQSASAILRVLSVT